MANELDELTGPVNDEGRDVNYINISTFIINWTS